MVLDSPYTDLKALVDRTLSAISSPAVLVRPILFDVAGWRAHYAPESVRPIEAIRKVKAPILLFHGTKDTLVPYADAEAFKAAAGGPLTLVPLGRARSQCAASFDLPGPHRDVSDEIAAILLEDPMTLRHARLALVVARSRSSRPQRAADPARLPDSTDADRTSLAVTVYNQNLALVRETRSLKIDKTGVAHACASWTCPRRSTRARSTSSRLSSGGPSVLEQNYEYDLISPKS